MKAFNIKIAYFLLLACCLEKATAAALPEEDLPPKQDRLLDLFRNYKFS